MFRQVKWWVSVLVRFFLRINLLVLYLSFMLPIYLMDK